VDVFRLEKGAGYESRRRSLFVALGFFRTGRFRVHRFLNPVPQRTTTALKFEKASINSLRAKLTYRHGLGLLPCTGDSVRFASSAASVCNALKEVPGKWGQHSTGVGNAEQVVRLSTKGSLRCNGQITRSVALSL
jgi:hypothetical protein